MSNRKFYAQSVESKINNLREKVNIACTDNSQTKMMIKHRIYSRFNGGYTQSAVDLHLHLKSEQENQINNELEHTLVQITNQCKLNKDANCSSIPNSELDKIDSLQKIQHSIEKVNISYGKSLTQKYKLD